MFAGDTVVFGTSGFGNGKLEFASLVGMSCCVGTVRNALKKVCVVLSHASANQ